MPLRKQEEQRAGVRAERRKGQTRNRRGHTLEGPVLVHDSYEKQIHISCSNYPNVVLVLTEDRISHGHSEMDAVIGGAMHCSATTSETTLLFQTVEASLLARELRLKSALGYHLGAPRAGHSWPTMHNSRYHRGSSRNLEVGQSGLTSHELPSNICLVFRNSWMLSALRP